MEFSVVFRASIRVMFHAEFTLKIVNLRNQLTKSSVQLYKPQWEFSWQRWRKLKEKRKKIDWAEGTWNQNLSFLRTKLCCILCYAFNLNGIFSLVRLVCHRLFILKVYQVALIAIHQLNCTSFSFLQRHVDRGMKWFSPGTVLLTNLDDRKLWRWSETFRAMATTLMNPNRFHSISGS